MAYAEYGAPAGPAVVVAHGTPGSRLQAALLDTAATELGLRLIAPDRPGYGGSSPRPGWVFQDWAGDVTQLLDRLELEQASILGISGGGGPALAAAHRLSSRTPRLVLASAMVPGAPRDGRRGAPDLMRTAFWLARHAPRVSAFALQRTSASSDPARPPRHTRSLARADARALLDPRIRESSHADGREAMRQGARAAVRELALYGSAPALPMAELTVPTVVIHGELDRNVPPSVARWAAAQIPTSRLILLPGQGHLFAATDPLSLLETLL